MESEPRLKACPFCGAPVRMRRAPIAGGFCFLCDNKGCGADVMFFAGDRRPKDVSVACWNRRDGDGR